MWTLFHKFRCAKNVILLSLNQNKPDLSFHPAGLLGDFILTILSPPLWTYYNPEGSPNSHKTRASSLQQTLVLSPADPYPSSPIPTEGHLQILTCLGHRVFPKTESAGQRFRLCAPCRHTALWCACLRPCFRDPEPQTTTLFQLSTICFLPLALPALLSKPFAPLLFPIPKEHRPLENTSQEGSVPLKKVQNDSRRNLSAHSQDL